MSNAIPKNLHNAGTLAKLLLVSMPLIVIVTIVLGARGFYYYKLGQFDEKILFIVLTSLKHLVFQMLPFLFVTLNALRLIRNKKSMHKSLFFIVAMLVPIAIISLYWYISYITSPFALGLLPLVNFSIVLPIWVLGKIVMGEVEIRKNGDGSD